MPFLAEELHQNLVRSVDPLAPLSVHLTVWPAVDHSRIDENLNSSMNSVLKLVTLGHAARNKANIKVRQPLAEVAFAVGNLDEQMVVTDFADLLCDELNVKSVRLLDGTTEAVSFSLNPLPMQLGQKYKALYPKIRQAIMAVDSDDAGRKLLDGGTLVIKVDGKSYAVDNTEVEVHTQSKSGFEVASDGPYLAALVTDLTPALVHEGLAREVVRRVQSLRKDAELEISDRIMIRYKASQGLDEAIKAFSDFITSETLATEISTKPIDKSWASEQDEFDNENSDHQYIQSRKEHSSMKLIKDYLFLFLVSGGIVGVDQITKAIVKANLFVGETWMPWSWLAPYARVVNWHNTGAAFGIFQQAGAVFAILAMVVALVIIIYFPKVDEKEKLIRVALAMQLGGALGNLVDRLTQGFVTDFISVGNFAVFNVADACITVGTGIFLLGIWLEERRMKKAADLIASVGDIVESDPEKTQITEKDK